MHLSTENQVFYDSFLTQLTSSTISKKEQIFYVKHFDLIGRNIAHIETKGYINAAMLIIVH